MVRKVLFVDDDQIMLLAIEKRFAAYSDSFTMVLANDGFEAVQKLKETSVSLIVLDLKMPRMDGMSLLSHTREKYPDIPVIIVSGYRTAEMYKLAKAKGVIAYISKPFQVDDLGKIIMSTLQKEADGGIMHKVSPTVFLQLMEMEAKTCTIRILDKNSGKGGILYFRDGSLLDARVGEMQGIEAAYRVFTWDDVTIFIQNECPDRLNVINSDLQPIIMKAVGMKDEAEDSLLPDEKDADLTFSHDLDSLAYSDGDLGSLEVPDELFEDDDLKVGSEPPLSEKFGDKRSATGAGATKSTQANTQPKGPKSSLEEIRALIKRQVGDKSGLIDINHDDSMGNVIEFLSELGSMFDFGKLKVGYIDNGQETDKILLPGQPSVVLKVSQKCPRDKIIQVLTQYH